MVCDLVLPQMQGTLSIFLDTLIFLIFPTSHIFRTVLTEPVLLIKGKNTEFHPHTDKCNRQGDVQIIQPLSAGSMEGLHGLLDFSNSDTRSE